MQWKSNQGSEIVNHSNPWIINVSSHYFFYARWFFPNRGRLPLGATGTIKLPN